MKQATKRAIVAFVRKMDPKGNIVSLTPDAQMKRGTIRISTRIKQGRQETVLTDEKYAEAYLLVRLIAELGYDASNIELQKAYDIGRPKPTKPRADLLLYKGANSPFLLAEAKGPDEYEAEMASAIEHQLFAVGNQERPAGLRYLAYYTVDLVGGDLVEKVRIIDLARFPGYRDWIDAGYPSTDLLPRDYGEARKAVYVNKPQQELASGEKRLDTSASHQTFAALRSNLHDVLWAGGGMFYNDIFTNLVKLFLAKIYDEETCEQAAQYRFQIEMVGKTPQSPDEIFKKVNKLYLDAQENFLGVEPDEHRRGIDTEKISRSKIAFVVESLQGYSLVKNDNQENSDLLGQFFEGIVEQGFKQSRGQFFTHRNIVRFMIHGLGIPARAVALTKGEENPASPRLPYICDPTVGSGTFLIETMREVTSALQSLNTKSLSARSRAFLESAMPKSKPNRWADEYIYGVEINPDLALATKVNMVVHGDGNINVYAADGLADFRQFALTRKVSALSNVVSFPDKKIYPHEVNERFDFILTNPPFSIKPDDHTSRSYERRFVFGGGRKSENLFIERWFQLLRPGGRVAAVLPESVFDTSSARDIRMFLYRFFRVDAVVSLPYLAFKPFTSTKTAILFATKRDANDVTQYAESERECVRVVKLLARVAKRLSTDGPKASAASLVTRLETEGDEVCEISAWLLGCNSSPQGIAKALAAKSAQWVSPDETRIAFAWAAKEFDQDVFYAEVDKVGYMRRRQGGDLVERNDLFAEQGGIVRTNETPPISALSKLLVGSGGDLHGFKSPLSVISAQSGLRCDPKYRWFWDRQGGRAFPTIKRPVAALSKFISIPAPQTIQQDQFGDAEKLMIELEDVEARTGRIIKIQEVEEIGSAKLVFGKCHLLLSRLEPYLGKVFLNQPQAEWIGSTEWLPIVVRDGGTPEFWMTLFVSTEMLSTFRMLQSGKRHARMSPEDLMNVLVPDIQAGEQSAAMKELNPLRGRVDTLLSELDQTRAAISSTLLKKLRGR